MLGVSLVAFQPPTESYSTALPDANPHRYTPMPTSSLPPPLSLSPLPHTHTFHPPSSTLSPSSHRHTLSPYASPPLSTMLARHSTASSSSLFFLPLHLPTPSTSTRFPTPPFHSSVSSSSLASHLFFFLYSFSSYNYHLPFFPSLNITSPFIVLPDSPPAGSVGNPSLSSPSTPLFMILNLTSLFSLQQLLNSS